MSDLISRQAAIDAVYAEYEKAVSNYDGFLWVGDIEKILTDLPTAQRWIPVSERLPEECGEYLVTDTSGDMFVNRWHSRFRRWQYDNDEVVAWTHIPLPYKGGEKDG